MNCTSATIQAKPQYAIIQPPTIASPIPEKPFCSFFLPGPLSSESSAAEDSDSDSSTPSPSLTATPPGILHNYSSPTRTNKIKNTNVVTFQLATPPPKKKSSHHQLPLLHNQTLSLLEFPLSIISCPTTNLLHMIQSQIRTLPVSMMVIHMHSRRMVKR
jgi:hypothetical protein